MDRDTYGRHAAGDYLEYQARYRSEIRESDRVIIDQVRALIALRTGERRSLLDIGCSTGNLLRHIRAAVPGISLHGSDVYEEIIERCRRDPELADVAFEVMNVLHLPAERLHDIVVVNAVLWMFSDADFETAVQNLAKVTTPGGELIAFDVFHDRDQEIEVFERSAVHPNGLALHFRPIARVRQVLGAAGFANIRYEPFRIPVDLPRPDDPANINSHTVRSDSGERLIFRGSLFTPWCHVFATRTT